ncbi:uncharacterized protein LOC114530870 isoform X2 [Dendronephthya gigantea]|nr:uncharacterized protein LOC114530870 isoform X2 [Dendronephthya gigantea]
MQRSTYQNRRKHKNGPNHPRRYDSSISLNGSLRRYHSLENIRVCQRSYNSPEHHMRNGGHPITPPYHHLPPQNYQRIKNSEKHSSPRQKNELCWPNNVGFEVSGGHNSPKYQPITGDETRPYSLGQPGKPYWIDNVGHNMASPPLVRRELAATASECDGSLSYRFPNQDPIFLKNTFTSSKRKQEETSTATTTISTNPFKISKIKSSESTNTSTKKAGQPEDAHTKGSSNTSVKSENQEMSPQDSSKSRAILTTYDSNGNFVVVSKEGSVTAVSCTTKNRTLSNSFLERFENDPEEDDVELISLEVKGKEKAVARPSDSGLNKEKETHPSGNSSQKSTNTLVSDVNVKMTKAGVGDAEKVKVDNDDVESLSDAESEVFDDIFLKTINKELENEVSDDEISPSRSDSISPTFEFDSTLLRNLDEHLRHGVENVVSNTTMKANKSDSNNTKETDGAAEFQEEDNKCPLVNQAASVLPPGRDSKVINNSSNKEFENTVPQIAVASGHDECKSGSDNPGGVASGAKEDPSKTTSSERKSASKTDAEEFEQRSTRLSLQECAIANPCVEPTVTKSTEIVLDRNAARGGSIQSVSDEIIEKPLDDLPLTEQSENIVADKILDTTKTHTANVEETSSNETELPEGNSSHNLDENNTFIGRTVGGILSNNEKSSSKNSSSPGNADFLVGTSQSCPMVDTIMSKTQLSEETSSRKTVETLLKTLDTRNQNKTSAEETSAENNMNVKDAITLIRDNCKESVKHSVTLLQSKVIKNGAELNKTGNEQETVLGNYKENNESQMMITKKDSGSIVDNKSSVEESKSSVGEESLNSSAENNNSAFVPLCESVLQSVNKELRENEVMKRDENKNSQMGIGDNSSQSGNKDDCYNSDKCDEENNRIEVIDVNGKSKLAASSETKSRNSSVYDTLHAELVASKMNVSHTLNQPSKIYEGPKDSETLEILTSNTEVSNINIQGEKGVITVSSSEAMAQSGDSAEDSQTNKISTDVSNNLYLETSANHDTEMHDVDNELDQMSKARTLEGERSTEEASEQLVSNVSETIGFAGASQLFKKSSDEKANDSDSKNIESQPLCNANDMTTTNVSMEEPNNANDFDKETELTSREQVAGNTHMTQSEEKQITQDISGTDLCISEDTVVVVANSLGIEERNFDESQKIDVIVNCATLTETAPEQQGGGDEKLSVEGTELGENQPDILERMEMIPNSTKPFASQSEIESTSDDKTADVEMTIPQHEELLMPERGVTEGQDSVEPEVVAPNLHVSSDKKPLEESTIVPGELRSNVLSPAVIVNTKKVDFEEEKVSESVSCGTRVDETKDDSKSNTDDSDDNALTGAAKDIAVVEQQQEKPSVGNLEKFEQHNADDIVVEDDRTSVQNINTSGENSKTKKIEVEINDAKSSEMTETTAVISKLLESKENCSVKHLLIDILTKNLEDTKKGEKNRTKHSFQDRSSGQSSSHDSLVTESEYSSTEDTYVQNLLTRAGQLSDNDMDVSSYDSSDIELGASTSSSETQEDKFSQSMKSIKNHDPDECGQMGETEKSSRKNSNNEDDVSSSSQQIRQDNPVEDDSVLTGFGHLKNNPRIDSSCNEKCGIKVGALESSSETLEGELSQNDELKEDYHLKLARGNSCEQGGTSGKDTESYVQSVLSGAHRDTKNNKFAIVNVPTNKEESQTSVCMKISTEGSTPGVISRSSSQGRRDVSRNNEEPKSTNALHKIDTDVSNTGKEIPKKSKGLYLHHTDLSMHTVTISKNYQEFLNRDKASSGNSTQMSKSCQERLKSDAPMNNDEIPKIDTSSSTCSKEDIPNKRKDISSDTKSDIVEPRRKRGRPRRTFPANEPTTPKRKSTRQRNPTRSRRDFGLMYSSNLSSREIPYYRNMKAFNMDVNLSSKHSGSINEYARSEKGREEKEREPLKYSIKQVIDLINVDDDFHLELESEDENSRSGWSPVKIDNSLVRSAISSTNILPLGNTTQTNATPSTNNLLGVSSTKQASASSSTKNLLGGSIARANDISPSNQSFGSSVPVLFSYPLPNCITPRTTFVVGSSLPAEINNSLANSAIPCKNVGSCSTFTSKNALGSLPKVNYTVTSATLLQRETQRDKNKAEISLESSFSNSPEVTDKPSEATLASSMLPSTIPKRRRGRPAILRRRCPESESIPKNVNKNINCYLSSEISSARTRPLVELLTSSRNASKRGSCTSGEQRPDSAMIHVNSIPKANSADRTLPDESVLPSHTLADFCCSFNSPVSPLSKELDVLSGRSSTSTESGEKGYSSTSTVLMDSQNSGSSAESLKITLISERDPDTGTTNWKASPMIPGTESGKGSSAGYGLRRFKTRKTKNPSPIPTELNAKRRRMMISDIDNEVQSPQSLQNLTKRPLEEYIRSVEKVYRSSDKNPKKGLLSIAMNDRVSKTNSREQEGDFLKLGDTDVMYEIVRRAYGDSKLKHCRPSPRSLYFAAKQGNALQVLVLASGCNVNATIPQEKHKTAMHAAAASGHVNVLWILSMIGGNLSSLDTKLQTPLFDAVENQQTEVVKFLIGQDVNLNLRDSQGMTVLHVAAQKSNMDIINLLMNTYKLDVNDQDNGGWTALMWTAEGMRMDAAKCLLNWGADVNILDKEKNTCLHWAALAGDINIMDLLLQSNVHIDARNMFGATALHISARERKLENIRTLAKYRPNLDIRNADGKKPIELVQYNTKCYVQLKRMDMLKTLAKYTLKERLISRDISRGQEKRPIPCINEVDDENLPDDFIYVFNNLECQSQSFDRSMTGCNCSDGCVNDKHCECAQLSARKRFWYDETGRINSEIFEEDRPLVYECNMKCKCWSNCHQRVVQRGITAGLQLYKTENKGWAVRTQALIPKGTFVCEYVGEILTDSEADRRKDDCYLFDLDVKGQSILFCLDAKFYGNITRFINHSCDPNILPVRVFTDHQIKSCPRIAFFAARDIKPYEEVCSNYGERFWTVKKHEFHCVCNTTKCKYGAAKK